jgi:predicted RNase H-like HicB family nuclease
MNEGLETKGYRLEVYQDPGDGSWVAEVPDLPGCMAAAETASEALSGCQDAILAWIDAARADGRPVPVPTGADEYSGRFVLRVPRSLHRRLASTARREGASLNAYCATALAESVGERSGVPVLVELLNAALTAQSSPSTMGWLAPRVAFTHLFASRGRLDSWSNDVPSVVRGAEVSILVSQNESRR